MFQSLFYHFHGFCRISFIINIYFQNLNQFPQRWHCTVLYQVAPMWLWKSVNKEFQPSVPLWWYLKYGHLWCNGTAVTHSNCKVNNDIVFLNNKGKSPNLIIYHQGHFYKSCIKSTGWCLIHQTFFITTFKFLFNFLLWGHLSRTKHSMLILT
jgi:hypothetical protein